MIFISSFIHFIFTIKHIDYWVARCVLVIIVWFLKSSLTYGIKIWPKWGIFIYLFNNCLFPQHIPCANLSLTDSDWTKMSAIFWKHFQMHFSQWKFCMLIQFPVNKDAFDSIGSCKGFVPKRQQTNARNNNRHSWGPFYYHGLTLIPAWISNYIHCKVWDEITYPFLNFNGCTVEV